MLYFVNQSGPDGISVPRVGMHGWYSRNMPDLAGPGQNATLSGADGAGQLDVAIRPLVPFHEFGQEIRGITVLIGTALAQLARNVFGNVTGFLFAFRPA